MSLNTQEVEDIYELIYKYQMLKEEAALGDYGLPQQLPDNAYIKLEKIKQELNTKLDDAFLALYYTFEEWLDKNKDEVWQELYDDSWRYTLDIIRSAKFYEDLQVFFDAEDLFAAYASVKPELENFGSFEEVSEYIDTLGPADQLELLKGVKEYLREPEFLAEIVTEMADDAVADYKAEIDSGNQTAPLAQTVVNIQRVFNILGSAASLPFDEKINVFQEALTTAHFNGVMAEHLLGIPNAKEFLTELSNDPAYAQKWNNDLGRLLGYPIGSRRAPKQKSFSAHLKQAIRMLAAALRKSPFAERQ